MKTKSKTAPSIVELAEQARVAKGLELLAAKRAVDKLEKEFAEAVGAVRLAQEQLDSVLPQCSLLRITSRSGKEEVRSRMVILRMTPGGLLVGRVAGEPRLDEFKFKWSPYGGVYREAAKTSMYVGSHRELRDVPSEFLPKSEGKTS